MFRLSLWPHNSLLNDYIRGSNQRVNPYWRNLFQGLLPERSENWFFFGDGGVPALIGKDTKFGRSWVSLNSDGSRESLIKIPGGG